MTDFERKIEAAIKTISSPLVELNWKDSKTYADVHAQLFYYVSHATRVTAFALSHTSSEDTFLINHFGNVIAEEGGHENLALNDLKALGFELDEFPMLSQTRAYYETLYANILQFGPKAHLAYFLVLEGVTATAMSEVYKTIENDYAENQRTFLHEHVILDQSHYGEALKMIQEKYPEWTDSIAEIGQYSADIFARMLKDLNSRNQQRAAA